jgi:hypothetical protein
MVGTVTPRRNCGPLFFSCLASRAVRQPTDAFSTAPWFWGRGPWELALSYLRRGKNPRRSKSRRAGARDHNPVEPKSAPVRFLPGQGSDKQPEPFRWRSIRGRRHLPCSSASKSSFGQQGHGNSPLPIVDCSSATTELRVSIFEIGQVTRV